MRAAYYAAQREIDVRDAPEPEPGESDVVIRVHACGICGTDQHIFHGELDSPFPFIGGHELVGEVTAAGDKVLDVRVGDRVAVQPNIWCGTCFFCQRGQINHCLRYQAIGVTRDGGFADYVLAPAPTVYGIGDMPYDTAAFVEPLSCVVYGLKRLTVLPGANAVVFGAGPIGLLMLQLLRHGGASTIVTVDLKEDKLALARQLGASETVSGGKGVEEALRDISPLGFDVVVDCTGVPAVVAGLTAYARNNGSIMYFGVNPPAARIEISPYDVYRRDLTILGSFAVKNTFQDAIDLLRAGAVDVGPLLSNRFTIDGFGDALELAFSGEALKVQIQP